MNQPVYPYASYCTQAGNPATNLHPIGNYPTQFSSGTIQQPQYQYQYQPLPQPVPYWEPEKMPSVPPPSYDDVHLWIISPQFFARVIDRWISQSAKTFLFFWCFFFTFISVDLFFFCCSCQFLIKYLNNECEWVWIGLLFWNMMHFLNLMLIVCCIILFMINKCFHNFFNEILYVIILFTDNKSIKNSQKWMKTQDISKL